MVLIFDPRMNANFHNTLCRAEARRSRGRRILAQAADEGVAEEVGLVVGAGKDAFEGAGKFELEVDEFAEGDAVGGSGEASGVPGVL